MVKRDYRLGDWPNSPLTQHLKRGLVVEIIRVTLVTDLLVDDLENNMLSSCFVTGAEITV